MTTCRECGHNVSSAAPVCPNCGVKSPDPKKHRAAATAGKFIVWAAVFVGGCTYVAIQTPLFFGTKEEQNAKNLADKRRDCTDERLFARAVVGADVEPDAMICPKGVSSSSLGELVRAVRYSGYSCDTVGFATFYDGASHEIWCDSSRHQYTLDDKGGRWQVSVK